VNDISSTDPASTDPASTDQAPADDGREPRSLEWAVATGARRSSLVFYRVVRRVIRLALFPFFRVRHRGAEHLDLAGPVIVAPVHRSNLDSPLVAGITTRRLRALGKESLFVNPVGAWVCAALGAIPITRGAADRDAMRAARTLLEAGEAMIVFPEGTRQVGNEVTGVFDGMSYLAAKTQATIVPVGIAGTEAAMPSGSSRLHRSRVAIVVGEPIAPPAPRTSRPALRTFSADVAARLQRCFDDANALAAP